MVSIYIPFSVYFYLVLVVIVAYNKIIKQFKLLTRMSCIANSCIADDIVIILEIQWLIFSNNRRLSCQINWALLSTTSTLTTPLLISCKREKKKTNPIKNNMQTAIRPCFNSFLYNYRIATASTIFVIDLSIHVIDVILLITDYD